MPKHPFKLREFIHKLKRDHGVVPMAPNRGKGSEIILLKPIEPGSKKGPQYPIKNHGEGTELSVPVIDKALERLEIDAADFWGESKKK